MTELRKKLKIDEFLSRKGLKLFLTFFLLYAFFIHWSGMNENSRLFLTKAIVDEGRLTIDSFYNRTGDRAYYQGHHYSDKEPGLSFLAVPVYGAWKGVYNFLFPPRMESKPSFITKRHLKGPIKIRLNLSLFGKITRILVTLISSLSGALLVLLVYKALRYLTDSERFRIWSSAALGLGTTVFHSSLVFMGEASATLLGFASFFLLWRLRKGKETKLLKKEHVFLLSGLLSGFSVVVALPSALVSIVSLFLAIKTRDDWEQVGFFLIGGILGIAPYLIYNYSIFGNPFELTFFHLKGPSPPEYVSATPSYGFLRLVGLREGLSRFLKLLISPLYGIFFYYPFLFLSLIGLIYFYKKYPFDFKLILYLLIAFLLFGSSFAPITSGTFFGYRYFAPLMPFLILPVPLILKRAKRLDKKLFLFCIALILISIFHNFVGLEPVVDLSTSINPRSFSFTNNPIYKHYFPLFLKYGPRSRLLEGILNLEVPDIRFLLPKDREYFSNFHQSLPFFSVFILGLFLILIWKKEFLNTGKKKWVITALLLLYLPSLFLVKVNKNQVAFKKGWYPVEDGHWMKKEGKITIDLPNSSKRNLKLNLRSYYKNRKVGVYLNGRERGKFLAFKQGQGISLPLNFSKGENTLKLKSNCSRVSRLGNEEDYRCLSVKIKDLSTNLKPIGFGEGWYFANQEGNRWMRQNGTVYLYSDKRKRVLISLDTKSLYKDREVGVYLNGEKIEEFKSFIQGNEIKLIANLTERVNELVLNSLDNCTVPANVSNTSDKRCLSIRLNNFSIFDLDQIKGTKSFFKENWYDKLLGEKQRWMKQNGTAFFFSSENRTTQLRFNLFPYLQARKVSFYLNGKLKNIFQIAKEGGWVTTVPLELKRVNKLKFHSHSPCTTIAEVLNNTDYRCVSIGIRNITSKT